MGRRSPALIMGVILVVVAALAQSLATASSRLDAVKATPGFVSPEACPPASPSGAANVTTSNIVSAGGDDARVRALTRNAKTLLRVSNATRSLRVRTPVTISGSEQGAVLSSSRVQVWIATQICQAPAIESWFVGGSGAIESQSRLTMTNTASSDATVEVTTWTNTGSVTPATLVVKARESTVVSLDRFALGSAAVAVRVRALSGRVASSLFDVRARGLTPLGADFVPAGVAPATRQVIVGVLGPVPTARLRLLAPGEQDAVARVDLVTGADRFTPAGLDQIELPAGQVVDVELPLKAAQGSGALVIEASAPVVAGLYQPGSKRQRDFAWLAPSLPLTAPVSALPTQFASTLVAFSPTTSTALTSTSLSRKGLTPISIGESTVVTVPLKSARWLTPNDQVYAAIISRAAYGLTVNPLNPLTRSRSRITPLPALTVIAPR